MLTSHLYDLTRRSESSGRAREDAFTLVELLVVIVVIAILAVIAVPVFLNQRDAASNSALKNDVRNAGTLLEGQGKFTGALPADLQTSDGVKLSAMRLSDRDNKVSSSQFVDGASANWGSYKAPPYDSTLTTQIFQKPSDGYKGMNYRRVTVSGKDTTAGGHTVKITAPEIVKKGDQYSVGIAVRQNYTGNRSMHVEFKKGGAFPGGISTKTLSVNNNWVYHTFTATAKGDGADVIHLSLYGPMKVGQSVDVTGAVIVKGDKVDPVAALSTSGYDFCVQGYHESDPDNFWRYSSLNGGLGEGKC